MSTTYQVQWIGPERFVPPLGKYVAGDTLYVTKRQRASLKAQGLVEDITVMEDKGKSHKRQEVDK